MQLPPIKYNLRNLHSNLPQQLATSEIKYMLLPLCLEVDLHSKSYVLQNVALASLDVILDFLNHDRG